MNRILFSLAAVLLGCFLAVSCHVKNDEAVVPGIGLTVVDTSRVQWTGVAVTQGGRVFACFPRMETDTIPYSVAIMNGSQASPFPNLTWNTWDPSLPAQDHFVCVQAVYTDDQNFLWVVDAASPQMRGVIREGAKLLKFNPNTGELVQRIGFSDMVVYETSYLNDVRVDTQKKIAYITDSGQGAIIVVDLTSGVSRRVLGRDPTTKSENLIITAEGRVWRNANGKLPSFDADGIALSPQRDYLYFHALTARSLYRIATQYLQDASLTDTQVAQHVEKVADTDPTDGMIFDTNGNLYLTGVQTNQVTRLTIGADGKAGAQQRLVQDARLKWPDTFSLGTNDTLYVTSSQLHIPRRERTDPYRIFKFNLK